MADTCVYIPKRRRRTYQQIEEDKRREREKEKKKREEQQRKEMEAEASSKTGKSLGLITSRERLLRSFESKRVDESDDEENGTHRSEKGTVKSEGEPPRYEGNEEEELAELLCKFGTSSTSGAAALDSDDGHSKSDEDEYKEEEEMSSGEEGGNEEGEVKLGAMTRRWYVDACERGNAARFINHSCQPNCVVERYVKLQLFVLRHCTKCPPTIMQMAMRRAHAPGYLCRTEDQEGRRNHLRLCLPVRYQ